MHKLLIANINRILKTRLFGLEMILCAILSAWIIFCNYNEAYQLTQNRLILENVFFSIYQIIILLPAVCVSMTIGTEYADGTIRNKLIVGHTRSEVYFSLLFANIFPSILVVLLHGIISYSIGYPLFGSFETSIALLALVMLSLILDMILFTILFAVISINCSSKSISGITSILLAYILIMAANFIQNRLYASEMIYENYTISANGIEYGNLIPNPSYISGMERNVYEVLYNLLPTGHFLQIQELDFSSAIYWPFISVVLIIGITILGYHIFHNKNIR